MTADEYLARERVAETKSEFFNGEVFALAGASPTHVVIATNVAGEIRTRLRNRDCTVYTAALRVEISATDSYAYPDVVVVCGALQLSERDKDTVTNPRLIVEVLSESTADYDRSGKFEHYRAIESFAEYLCIAQDRCHVERWVRQPDRTWRFSESNQIEAIVALESVDVRLPLAAIYGKALLHGARS
jgi:Uma2 family endonuclease